MEIVNKYIAYDGTEFYDMEDCERYENLMKEIPYYVHFYTEEGYALSGITIEDNEDVYAYSTYVGLDRDVERYEQEYLDWMNYYGFVLPTKPGFYKWSKTDNEWITLQEGV